MTTVLIPPPGFGDDRAVVTGDTYHHLFRVRRLELGERLRVVDGLGHAREGRVATVGRHEAHLDLGAAAPALEPAREVRLLVAAPKPDRASWLVEKATEVGVVAVHFIDTDRAPREVGRGILERLARVALAAVEQCGRSRVPAITGGHAWAEVGALLATCPTRLVLDLAPGPEGPAGARGGEASEGTAGAGAIAVLVGPEGGWTVAERAALAALGARPWGLGARILRVETAAVVAAALLLLPSPS